MSKFKKFTEKKVLEEGFFDWVSNFFGSNAQAKARAAEEIVDFNQIAIAEKLLMLYSKNPKALLAFFEVLPNIKDNDLKQRLAKYLYMFFIFHGKEKGFFTTNASKLAKSKDPAILKGAEEAAELIDQLKAK